MMDEVTKAKIMIAVALALAGDITYGQAVMRVTRVVEPSLAALLDLAAARKSGQATEAEAETIMNLLRGYNATLAAATEGTR